MWWELRVRVSVIQCHLKSQAIQVQQVNKHWPLKLSNTLGSCGCHRLAPVWIQQYIQTATLSDGKSEEFLSFNYSFLSLSNTSLHTMKRKTKKNNGNSISAFRCKYPNQLSCNKLTLGQFSLHALADSHMKYFEANNTQVSNNLGKNELQIALFLQCNWFLLRSGWYFFRNAAGSTSRNPRKTPPGTKNKWL